MTQYLTLLTTHPPRPIKTDEELAATMQVIDSLFDRSDLTQDEQDYLALLAIVVQDYESGDRLIRSTHP